MAVPPVRHAGVQTDLPFITTHPDLSVLEKSAVEAAILEAWRRLPAAASERGIDLNTAAEEPITRLLRDELDVLRCDERSPVPGFSQDTFQHIPESEAVAASHDSLSVFASAYPDLVFRPCKKPKQARLTVEYGLFVECKIVDRSKKHHSIGCYCEQGIARFVDGRYAAWMPSAMMVAYVRGQRDAASNLGSYLARAEHVRAFQVIGAVTERPCGGRSSSERAFVSRHGRAQVRVRGVQASGDIELTHLWLHRALV